MLIHLGQGIFKTNGYYEESDGTPHGWQVKPNTRIVGSGMAATTIQLTEATGADHYFAVAHSLRKASDQSPKRGHPVKGS